MSSQKGSVHKKVFDNAADGILVADIKNKKFHMGNKMICDMLGYSLEEIKNMGVMDIHPDEDIPYAIEQFKKLSRQQINLAKDIPIKRKHGSIFYVDIKSFLITLHGKPYIAGIFRDTTELKQAQDALKEKENFLSDILNSIQDSINVLDKDLNILFSNPCSEKWFASKAPIVGKKCYKAFHDRTEPCESCPSIRTLNTEKPDFKITSFQFNGAIYWFEIYTFPFYDAKTRQLTGVIEYKRNITERKKAEILLKESEEKYRSFIQNFKGIAYHGRIDFTPIFFHGAIKEITGYTEDEFLTGNLKWKDIIYPEDLSLISESVKNILSVPNYSTEREYRIICKDGQIRWLCEQIQNICDTSGKPVLVQGALYDVTTCKLREIALQEKEKELKIKNVSLEEANIALRVLLDKRQKDKTELEEKILLNIKELIIPSLEKVKKSILDEKQKTHVSILESNLKEITSSFSQRLSSRFLNFTPTEIQIANLLKQGKTNKEIGELLHSSPKTIAFHRDNIRKKLGLKNKKINLKSYLLSLT